MTTTTDIATARRRASTIQMIKTFHAFILEGAFAVEDLEVIQKSLAAWTKGTGKCLDRAKAAGVPAAVEFGPEGVCFLCGDQNNPQVK